MLTESSTIPSSDFKRIHIVEPVLSALLLQFRFFGVVWCGFFLLLLLLLLALTAA